MSDHKRRRRWGASSVSADKAPSAVPSAAPVPSSTATSTSASDDAAVAALIASSAPKKEERVEGGQKRGRDDSGHYGPQQQGRGGKEGGHNRRDRDDSGHYGPQQQGRGEKEGGHNGRDRRGDGDRGRGDDDRWGGDRREGGTSQSDVAPTAEDEKPKNKQKANFGLSGALASDEHTGNVFNGVVLKFTEPPEARAPNTRWRLYVFKKKKTSEGSKGKNGNDDDDLLEMLHISQQSAYLLGRDRRVADIPVDHPSLSSQHAVLQYRALPDPTSVDPNKLRCRPYIMDLESTNGTFLNSVRIEGARYYELRKGDVLKFGGSTREYVLLTEHATSAGTSTY